MTITHNINDDSLHEHNLITVKPKIEYINFLIRIIVVRRINKASL